MWKTANDDSISESESRENLWPDDVSFSQEYFVYCKKRWRSQDAKDPGGAEDDGVSVCPGQVSSPKKNHAAARTVRDLWLDACLLFYQFCKNASRLKCKTEKSCSWSNGFYIRASIDLWPKIRDSRIFAAVRTCWGVPSPNPAERKKRSFLGTQRENGHRSLPAGGIAHGKKAQTVAHPVAPFD